MAKESVHKKLERVRPPRVHVTYDVEVGDAIEVKELPFVMGILADLSGQPTEALPKLKDRRFVEINPDNFDSVLESFKPHLSLEVDNKLSDEADAGKLKVDIDFKSLDVFDPASVAKNVKPLRELLELRQKLGDLRRAPGQRQARRPFDGSGGQYAKSRPIEEGISEGQARGRLR